MKSLKLASAFLLAAQTATAQLVAEGPEPNNTPATATVLPFGRQAFGTIDTSGNDTDTYKITLTERSDLKVWTGAGTSFAGQLNCSRLFLLAGNGVSRLGEFAGWSDETGRYASFLMGDMAPGDYYIVVSGELPVHDGNYSIEAVAGPVGSLAPYTQVAAWQEPDDPRFWGTPATTTWNTINAGFLHAGGSGDRDPFAPNVDYDIFAIQLPCASHLDFELLQSNDPNAAPMPVMFLLDSGFAPLQQSQPVGQGGIVERMSFDAPGAGLYYVGVHGLWPWDIGTFKLLIKGVVGERAEENDPRVPGGVATPSQLNTIHTGFSSVGGNSSATEASGADYDWYQFTVPTPGLIVCDTLRAYSSPGYLFPILHLFDSNHTLLSVSFPMGAGEVVERIGYQVSQPGVYYVAVSGWSPSDVGTYGLRIQGPSAARATTTEVPGNCPGTAGAPGLAATMANTNPMTWPERPVLGSTYTLTGSNLPANAPLFRMTGLLPRPSPYDLGPLGAPGCFVFVDPASCELSFADAGGNCHWPLPLPLQLPLIGLPLDQQLLVLDPAANPLGLTTSGHVVSTCGTGH